MKRCRYCKGTGIDSKLAFRYTTGGHNDRSCEHCNGDGFIDNGLVVELADTHGLGPCAERREGSNPSEATYDKHLVSEK